MTETPEIVVEHHGYAKREQCRAAGFAGHIITDDDEVKPNYRQCSRSTSATVNGIPLCWQHEAMATERGRYLPNILTDDGRIVPISALVPGISEAKRRQAIRYTYPDTTEMRLARYVRQYEEDMPPNVVHARRESAGVDGIMQVLVAQMELS